MYILCEKYNNEIICICKELDYMENGYPRDVLKNMAYPIETTFVYENVDVPDNISEYRYCYTESEGFYLNPSYREPSHTINEDEYNQLTANVDYLLLLNDAI